ncbi:MAG: hypothetical protein ABEH78_02185 [Haloferacaceae archaeon]
MVTPTCPECDATPDQLAWNDEITPTTGGAWMCPDCGAILGVSERGECRY